MKKRLNCILLVFILIFSLLTVVSNAADLSFTTTMTPSKTSVTEATEVNVTVKVSNLNVGTNGINTFSANLSYDTDVFETLTDSSVEGLNNWSSTYSASSGKILLSKNSFVNSDEEIMQITLKTKSGVTAGTQGTVSLSGIQASNSESKIDSTNVSTTITVGTSSTGTVKINPTTNNTNATNNTNSVPANNTTNTNVVNNTNMVNTNTNIANKATTNIPYTGPSEDAFIKIILGVVLVALAIYIKIRKMDEIK